MVDKIIFSNLVHILTFYYVCFSHMYVFIKIITILPTFKRCHTVLVRRYSDVTDTGTLFCVSASYLEFLNHQQGDSRED